MQERRGSRKWRSIGTTLTLFERPVHSYAKDYTTERPVAVNKEIGSLAPFFKQVKRRRKAVASHSTIAGFHLGTHPLS